MIVADASALLELLLRTQRGLRVETRLFESDDTWHAPHVVDVEIAQTLRRQCAAGELTVARAAQALRALLDLPLTRYPHDLLLLRIWALRETMTAYDAAYVALAEALDAPLVTCDGPLARASGHHARLELF